jgi:two-component system NtrC family response regulator
MEPNLNQTRILIIDDEGDVCTFFSRLLGRGGYQVATARNLPEVEQALAVGSYQVAMVDLKLPDTDGLSLLSLIKQRQADCEVILMTGYSTVKTAVTAIQLGAYDYLEKPFDDISEIERLIARAAARSRGESTRPGQEEWQPTAQAVGFQVGPSPVMRQLAELAFKIAGKQINVLIHGKTGTGKEVLARFIHAASQRADQPFIPINCGALPESLLESELFGHERGAFTGANSIRRGIFELANRGTLFLDEIGDASPLIQVKLLRILETGEFMRVGGEKALRTDVRVLAASNIDLEQAIRTRQFREDLYYRLNVVRLDIPTLQEHPEDIPLLAETFVQQINPELSLAPATQRLLVEHPWPGNIRQLLNTLRGAAALSSGRVIQPGHLGSLNQASVPDGGRDAAAELSPVQAGGSGGEIWRDLPSREVLEQLDEEQLQQCYQALQGWQQRLMTVMGRKGLRPPDQDLKAAEVDQIRRALEQHRWNITEAARSLGVARNTLHRKINKYRLREL